MKGHSVCAYKYYTYTDTSFSQNNKLIEFFKGCFILKSAFDIEELKTVQILNT